MPEGLEAHTRSELSRNRVGTSATRKMAPRVHRAQCVPSLMKNLYKSGLGPRCWFVGLTGLLPTPHETVNNNYLQTLAAPGRGAVGPPEIGKSKREQARLTYTALALALPHCLLSLQGLLTLVTAWERFNQAAFLFETHHLKLRTRSVICSPGRWSCEDGAASQCKPSLRSSGYIFQLSTLLRYH